MIRPLTIVCSLALVSLAPLACQTVPETAKARKELNSDVQTAIEKGKTKSQKIADHLKDSYAYAVIPHVGKGAVGVGGAYGKGEVYKGGNLIGYCDLSQGSIGLQLGGQSFNEFIFFQNKEALQKMLDGKFAFSASATAVAANAGAGAANDYTHGVCVILTGMEGLMFEAAIGGQQFNYRSLESVGEGK